MKAFLILEDGTVFEGTSIGADKEVISEIVFNTSMTGYLEVLTDPSYAGQAVVMTYPLIGNYGITPDMINQVIEAGIEGGMSYDLIYLDTCRRISEITGEEFVCTASDMARAFNVSDDEMDKIIKEAREELIEAGEDPDEYFREVPVHRFMM